GSAPSQPGSLPDSSDKSVPRATLVKTRPWWKTEHKDAVHESINRYAPSSAPAVERDADDSNPDRPSDPAASQNLGITAGKDAQ
ncbi:hypothetical protein, partial [Arthrobacter rhombi]|uniref:hypothetical protein n=1 Tax=Arthrobacter rhombi TaxID=71253 RepID=UPI003FD69FE1